MCFFKVCIVVLIVFLNIYKCIKQLLSYYLMFYVHQLINPEHSIFVADVASNIWRSPHFAYKQNIINCVFALLSPIQMLLYVTTAQSMFAAHFQ